MNRPILNIRITFFAFCALKLLVGRQKEHPACKKLSDWRGCLSAVRHKCFAYDSADATATRVLNSRHLGVNVPTNLS